MSTCSYPSSLGLLYYIDENKFISFLTTSTFVIIGTFLYIVSLYRFFEKQNIPTFTQPTAPYGNIKDVVNKDITLFELISTFYFKLKKKGCKYGGMYLFFKPGIVLVDTSLISEILLNKTVFIDVNTNESNHEITSGLFVSSEIIKELLNNLSATIRNDFVISLRRDNGTFKDGLHKFVLDSMCDIYGLEKNDVIQTLITTSEKDMTNSSLKHHFLLVYPFFKLNKKKDWNIIVQNIMLNRKKRDIRKKDILQNIIDSMNEIEHTWLIEYLNKFIKNIIYTYHSSLLCLYELSKDINIQKELIGEIRRFDNSDKDLNDLPYLDAVVKETLRKYPPVPIIIKRCEENYESTTSSLKFTKSNFVLIPISAVHHDTDIYVDPENFDPDRFLEDDKEKKDAFLPFGSKVTSDEDFNEFQISIVIMKVILVSIFSNFEIKLSNSNYFLSFDSTKLNMQFDEIPPLEFKPLS